MEFCHLVLSHVKYDYDVSLTKCNNIVSNITQNYRFSIEFEFSQTT